MSTFTNLRTDMPFPERLTALRKQRGLTQESLGEVIGITKTPIYRYESGT